MTQASGSNGYVAYGEETTYGSTPGSPSLTLLKGATYGEALGGSVAEVRSNAISNVRDIQDVKGGNVDAGGSIPFELALNDGVILKHLLGDTVQTTGTGPYTHVIKRGALPTSLYIEKGFTDVAQYVLFNGVRIESLQLNVQPEGLIAGSLEVKAAAITRGTSSVDATPTDLGHNAIIHHEADLVEEGGAAAILLGLEFTITNNLDQEKFRVGSRYRTSMPEGVGECTGTVTFQFEDETYFNKWINETASSLEFRFTQGTSSITFLFPNIKYTGDAVPKIETDKGIITALPFRAIHDAVENSDVVITLVNGQSAL